MPYDLAVYDAAFYATFGHEAEKMAPWLMPLLNRVIPFESLVDVGCGEGWYVYWLIGNRDDPEEKNFFGIEGSTAAVQDTVIPDFVGKHDLRKPFRSIRKYDIAFSLEVAEHIEEEYAPVFVDTLCNLSDTVVMTAAPPGQGGLMHCNERPQEYWKELFFAAGFHPDHFSREKLKDGIRDAEEGGKYVTPWLLPNIMVYRRSGG